MSKAGSKQPGLDNRHRDKVGEVHHARTDTKILGMRAFEKISAVEGVRLTGEMRREATSLSTTRASGIARASSGQIRKK